MHRISNPESSAGSEKDRGRTRGPRRRLTEYKISVPESASPTLTYRSHLSSEDGNSEHSFASYTSSPCQEMPRDFPKHHQSAFPHPGPFSGYGSQAFPHTGFYQDPRQQSSPSIPGAYYKEEVVYPPYVDVPRSYYAQQAPCPSNRYECWYKPTPVPLQRTQRPLPPAVRLSPSSAQHEHPHYCSSGVPGLPRQVVNEQLKSWHRRSQLKAPRSRSLDRQGAVRVKNTTAREPSYQNQTYHEQVSRQK